MINKKFKLRRYHQDFYLFIVFLIMSISIITKSYFNFDGYLTSDSTNYLTLAQNLLNGNGYYLPVSPYANTVEDKKFFAAIWPIGYPTLIFLIAKITSLSVFWASKILNIMLIGIILGIFRTLFKENSYVYGLIFFFASYIEIFTYTWSESLFITALLLFTTSIYFFMKSPQKMLGVYLLIILSSLLLFISRYIGAFSFGLIGLLGIYYVLMKKERFKGIILISIAIVNTLIMLLYLYHNYVETGYITGMQRIASWESNWKLFHMLQTAVFAEILIPSVSKIITLKAIVIYSLQILILFFLFLKYQKNNLLTSSLKEQSSMHLSTLFMIIGLVYLFFIILMRWITQFDVYNFRLLGPGSFLLFIAFISFIQERTSKEFFNAFSLFIFFFSFVSFIWNSPYQVYKASKENSNYFQSIDTIKEKFQSTENQSIVIFAPKHLNYIYPHLEIREPASLPYSSYTETWSHFMNEITLKKKKSIYLFIPKEKFPLKVFDKSVIKFLSQYDKGSLVKIK